MKKNIKDITHSFHLNDVKKFGSIEKALIMKEIKNMALYKLRNGKDGWIYYSAQALSKKFCYMKRRSITRWLIELEKEGYLKSQRRNKHKYDLTKSYFVTELFELFETKPLGQNDPTSGQNDPTSGQNSPTRPSLSTSLSTTLIEEIIFKYFETKGINKITETERKMTIAYHKKDAKELLELSGSIENAKKAIRIIANWAKKRNLDYTIGTFIKKYYQLEQLEQLEKLKPQKKPFYKGFPMIKKTNGKWYVIKDNEWLEYCDKKELIDWK